MINIFLTDQIIEQEPGPNLVFLGNPEDYLQLISRIHSLGTTNGKEMILNDFKDLIIKDFLLRLKSVSSANILCKISDDNVLIELDYLLWQEVIHNFLTISFCPSHNYIEFEGSYVEDANIIIKSDSLI